MASIKITSDDSRLRREADDITSGELTIIFFVLPDSAPAVESRGYRLSNVSNGQTRSDGTEWKSSDAGTSTFESVDEPNVIAAATLVHIGFTLNSTNVKLYINGILVETDTVTTVTSDTGFSIGERGGSPLGLVGEYAVIRIWDRVLTDNEILTEFTTKGRGSNRRGLVLGWNGTEAAPGTTITDGMIKSITGDTFEVKAEGVTSPEIGAGSIPAGYRRRAA